MVKTPRTRHSKAEREPMTIELGPDEILHVPTENDAATAESGTATVASEQEAEGLKEEGIEAPNSVSEPVLEVAPDTTFAEAAPEPDPETASAFGEQPKREEPPAAQTDPHEPRGDAGTQPPNAPPPSQVSRGSALTAGLAGGVVALAAGWLLQYAGVLGAPGSGGPVAPAVPAAIESEVAALKSEIEGLKAGAGNAGDLPARIDGLAQVLDQVKADVASLSQAVQSGGAGESAGLQALNTKIAEIETNIAKLGQGATGPTPEEVAAINEKVAGVEALAKAAGEAGSVFDGRLGALEQSLSSLTAKVDAQAQQPKIALAIAASALKSAIERGAPFEPELETFAAIAPQAPGLAELRAYAEKGVATRADLIAEMDAAANTMIAAASPPPQDADIFERLLSSAESLVSVRPIGAVEGAGVPETVARMEVALQAGDLAKAMTEFDTLPAAAKVAGAAFADRIRARHTVEQLADQAVAAAMQA